MHQLEINAKETDLICEELEMIEENIEVDYNNFIDTLNSKRRQQQEENAKDVLKNALSVEQARKLAQEKEAASEAAKQKAESQLSEPKKVINNIINKINTKVHENLPQPQQVSMSVTIDPSKKNTQSAPNNSNSDSKSPINLNLEELTHDDDLNRFLDDPVKAEDKIDNSKQTHYDEDDEEESNNPMVAAFKEEIDSSDEVDGKNKVCIQVNVSDDEPEETPNDEKSENLISKMTSHNSSSSNASSNLASSLIQVKNSSNFETISSTTSMSLVNCDSTSQTSYSMPILDSQMTDIKFSNDDFEFLEKVSTEKKSKSKKSLKNEDGSDDLKTKSKKKKSKSKDLNGLSDQIDEKKEKKKSKKKDSKSAKVKINQEDDEDDSINVNIKRDLDYEEL